MNEKIPLGSIMIVIVSVITVVGLWYFYALSHRTTELEENVEVNTNTLVSNLTIKVGILHSLTGTMAISEKAVVDAELLAIDEINAKGGLLGRLIEPVVVDGRSDSSYSAEMAKKLITEDKVSVVFGCWTSACRKTVAPIFEKYNHLLVYPLQYEGLEQSPNIVYTGATPNQQIIPAVKWSMDHVGTRFFLVGSDYIFPRAANEIIKQEIMALGGQIVGEEYIPLGSKNVNPIVQKIDKMKPDMILNTINGDSNLAFFQALIDAGIKPDNIPVMSFSIGEQELQSLNPKKMAGNYAAWNYFQSISTEKNKKFVEAFKKKYGGNRVIDDPMESAYYGVYLWAAAVNDANSETIDSVLKTIKKQGFNGPEGTVYVDPDNNNTWKKVRIGIAREDGQFDILWSSDNPVQPILFPIYHSKIEWESFLKSLYLQWGGKWANNGS